MENMYTNTSKIDTTNTVINLLKINSGINENTHKTEMEQNYYQFEQKYYNQTDKPWVPQYQQYYLKQIFKT
jgi:hypothetical protein